MREQGLVSGAFSRNENHVSRLGCWSEFCPLNHKLGAAGESRVRFHRPFLVQDLRAVRWKKRHDKLHFTSQLSAFCAIGEI